MKKSLMVVFILLFIMSVFITGCQSGQVEQTTNVKSDQSDSSYRVGASSITALVERTNESANLTTAQDTIDHLSLVLNTGLN